MNNFGNILLFDIEEIILDEDIQLVSNLVSSQEINLIVIADWFDKEIFCQICNNVHTMNTCNGKIINKGNKSSFLVPNNLLSLNKILDNFDIEFAYRSVSGNFKIKNKDIGFNQGTYLRHYPNYGFIKKIHGKFSSEDKNNQFFKLNNLEFAILGMFYTTSSLQSKDSFGKLFIFGNSTCFENQNNNDCLSLIDMLGEFFRKYFV